MSIALDEYGQPFIILQGQEEKSRLSGIEAHKANILAARAVADTLRTSLGPKGMDKIIVSSDGNVTVTNDGATILSQMEIEHQCAKLLVELSKSQDEEIGDGTTGVVILAGALLEQSYRLLQKGLHPLRVADGYDHACTVATNRLKEIATSKFAEEDHEDMLLKAAITALGSKVVNAHKKELAKAAVDAVKAVADLERQDVNFDLIRVQSKPGGSLGDTAYIPGVVLEKNLSHSQMPKITRDARIAILSCPFEPPKPKTKHKLDIKSADDYKKLQATEQKYFTDMVDMVEKAGANFVICQWGFDDEANHLLMQRNLPAVRWVGGVELELIAIATGGRIVPRFEELTPDKLGRAGLIREVSSGTEHNESILIEECANTKTVTIQVRGGNNMIIAEAERSIHDAMCCVRNLIKCPEIVPGGGASEIAMSIAVDAMADSVSTVEQYAVRAFGESLLALPEALAENSGLNSIDEVAHAKYAQIKKSNPNFGIDCMNMTHGNMLEAHVYESLASKVNQLALATQVVKMILKIDDIIGPTDFE